MCWASTVTSCMLNISCVLSSGLETPCALSLNALKVWGGGRWYFYLHVSVRIELRHREVKELAQSPTVNGRAGFKLRASGSRAQPFQETQGHWSTFWGEQFSRGDSPIHAEV